MPFVVGYAFVYNWYCPGELRSGTGSWTWEAGMSELEEGVLFPWLLFGCWVGKNACQQVPCFSLYFQSVKDEIFSGQILAEHSNLLWIFPIRTPLRNRNFTSILDRNYKISGTDTNASSLSVPLGNKLFQKQSIFLDQFLDKAYKITLKHLVICLKWERFMGDLPWDQILKGNRVKQLTTTQQ